MANNRPSRRTIILGAAAAAAGSPSALLMTESIARAAAASGALPTRGPVHDWLDAFAAKKHFGASASEPGRLTQ